MRTDSTALPRSNKALAAAFLAHQVEELQQQIQDINVGSHDRHSGPRTRGSDRAGLVLLPGGSRGGRENRHGSDLNRSSNIQVDGASRKVSRTGDLLYSRLPQPSPSPSILLRNSKNDSASTSISMSGSSTSPRPSACLTSAVTASTTESLPPGNGPVVVDGSALIWALPSIKRILARGDREIIIPAEVLHTLDLLKKGSSTLPQAVRIATRFVETYLSIPDSTNPSRQPYRGLRVARSSEQVDLPDFTHSDETPSVDSWIRSIIGTVLYTAQSSTYLPAASPSASSPSKPVLLVSSSLANDSLSVDEEQGFEPDRYDYAVRALGEDVMLVAKRYEVETFWMAPSLVGGPGLGGGRGDGGRGGCGFRGGGRGEGRGRGRGGGRSRGREQKTRNDVPQETPKVVLLKRPT